MTHLITAGISCFLFFSFLFNNNNNINNNLLKFKSRVLLPFLSFQKGMSPFTRYLTQAGDSGEKHQSEGCCSLLWYPLIHPCSYIPMAMKSHSSYGRCFGILPSNLRSAGSQPSTRPPPSMWLLPWPQGCAGLYEELSCLGTPCRKMYSTLLVTTFLLGMEIFSLEEIRNSHWFGGEEDEGEGNS